MTEYAAIRIDFTLQGVVHLDPLESLPARGQPTDNETPVY